VTIAVDAVPPGEPTADPTDGKTVTGTGDPGDTIVIRDDGGKDLCTTVVRPDGTWSCDLQPPAAEGDMIQIIERDPAGNESGKIDWRVGKPRAEVANKTLYVGDTQKVTGFNFQPGEEITATQFSAPYAIGVAKANANGTVEFTYVIPVDTDLGVHDAELSGPLSGKVSDDFQVVARPVPAPTPKPTPAPAPAPKPLPFTGASDLVAATGAALGALLTGLLLLLLLRRRKEDQAQ
jgi:LPXTG-motif cell wall-anchored protein